MLAALASVVHDRQGADGQQHIAVSTINKGPCIARPTTAEPRGLRATELTQFK